MKQTKTAKEKAIEYLKKIGEKHYESIAMPINEFDINEVIETIDIAIKETTKEIFDKIDKRCLKIGTNRTITLKEWNKLKNKFLKNDAKDSDKQSRERRSK